MLERGVLPVCRKLWCVAIYRRSDFLVAIAGAARVRSAGEVLTFLS